MKTLFLIIRRFAAFGIDWLVFTLLSFPVALYFWMSGLDPKAMSRIQTVLLWMWLIYFVLFEWLYAGTIGKFILRLAVKRTDGTRLSLMTALSRTGLSFLIPCVLSVFIIPAILFFNSSQISEYAAMMISSAVLVVLPISIFVLGGQSIADVVLHTCVVPVGADTAKTSITSRNRWIVISALSLLVGVFFSWIIGLSHQMLYGTTNMKKGEFLNALPPDLIDTRRLPSHTQRFTEMSDIRGEFVREPHQNGTSKNLTMMDIYGNGDSFDELMVMRRVAFYMSELPEDQRPECMAVSFIKEFDAVLTGFLQEHEMVVCDVPKGLPDKATLIDRGMAVSVRWKIDVQNIVVQLIGESGEDFTRLIPHKVK